MPLADVEKKVMASAEKEAREIAEKADAEAKAELERRSAALRDEQQRAIAAAKADADAAAERDIGSRRADHMMALLRARNEILDSVFAAAAERALAAQGFDYARWLASQARRACAAGAAGTLYCADRDRPAVEAAVREAGADNVKVGREPGLMRGGVYFVGKGLDLDLTLDATLADLRDEGLVAYAERLFKDVPTLAATSPADGEPQ